MEEKIKDYFKRYPNSKECFVNGGLLFHTRGAADSYGKDETKVHHRTPAKTEAATTTETKVDDAEAARLEQEEIDRKAQEEADRKAAQKVEAIKKIANTEDLTSIAYQEQVKLVKALDLETENQKGETILKALSEYKETLKDE